MSKKTSLSTAIALSLGTSAVQAAKFNMTFMDFIGTSDDNFNVVGTVDTTNGGSGSFNSGGILFWAEF